MNVYLTEEEQVEQIKSWLKKYAFSIITGVVLGLALMYGWQYWSSYKNKQVLEASVLFDKSLVHLSDDEVEAAKTEATTISSDYPKTPYATMANFFLAKEAMAEDKASIAEDNLTWVINNTKTKAFQEIARLRAAKLLAANQQTDEALALLDKVSDSAFISVAHELKGDIYAAEGKVQQAREAYLHAKNNDPQFAMLRPVLGIKLDNIGASQGASQ